jgi:hypothetical protein
MRRMRHFLVALSGLTTAMPNRASESIVPFMNSKKPHNIILGIMINECSFLAKMQ